MDHETTEVLTEQKQLQELVEHAGWKIARKMFAAKILELQNAFEIDDKDPAAMIVDLKSRKLSSQTLYAFLTEIEGTASQSADNSKVPDQKPYIYVKK